jgi:hypothetical protein
MEGVRQARERETMRVPEENGVSGKCGKCKNYGHKACTGLRLAGGGHGPKVPCLCRCQLRAREGRPPKPLDGDCLFYMLSRRAQGWNNKHIAEEVGLHLDTVGKYLLVYDCIKEMKGMEWDPENPHYGMSRFELLAALEKERAQVKIPVAKASSDVQQREARKLKDEYRLSDEQIAARLGVYPSTVAGYLAAQ